MKRFPSHRPVSISPRGGGRLWLLMAALAISSAFPWRALAWQEAVLEVPAPDRLADPDEPSAVEVMEEDPFGVPDGDVSPDSDASDASVAGEERDSGAGPAVTGRSRRPPPRNRPLPIDMKIDRKRPIPPAAPFHMGREIAQTMHYTGAPWLVRESRQREEDCRMMIEALGVQPGQSVCDMGAGNGFYTLELARLVGPEGLVYAVDIQPPMLQMLSRRAAQEGLTNIRLVLGSPIDPRLPAGEIDLVAAAPLGPVCFVEVKARKLARTAAESVGPGQQTRIARAASLYLASRPGLARRGARFDIIAIAPRSLSVHHRDVWRPERF